MRVVEENLEGGDEPMVVIIGTLTYVPTFRSLVPAWAEGGGLASVITGAGQGGLTLAARLKQLGIPTLIVERNERIGDNWRKRYHQLVLHDPVWYDHLYVSLFPISSFSLPFYPI